MNFDLDARKLGTKCGNYILSDSMYPYWTQVLICILCFFQQSLVKLIMYWTVVF